MTDDEATGMCSRTQTSCLGCHLQMRSIKFFFLVSCTYYAFSLFWVQFAAFAATRPDLPAVTENLHMQLLKDFKYILLWTRSDYAPFYYLGEGQRAFLGQNCSLIKCYVTANRKFFGGDLTKFDAIAFNGRNMNTSDLPSARSRNQLYIFFNMESAENFPVCGAQFDGFFNWTSTYRLDSDIPFPYILIRDNKGNIVGPKRKMRWREDYVATIDDQFANRNRILNKSKAAAWFVSNCKTRVGREGFVKSLKDALKPYGLTVDVYGKCGTLQCPRSGPSKCKHLLKNDYYFYMSLENSFDEDYVTEKLLTALQSDVVPIIYGGADYARFVPPGSYIDGRNQHVGELAFMMNELMQDPYEYNKYFRWKQHYSYHNPAAAENVCAVCEALHDKKKQQKTKIYDEFRHWWNPKYGMRCIQEKVTSTF